MGLEQMVINVFILYAFNDYSSNRITLKVNHLLKCGKRVKRIQITDFFFAKDRRQE